MRVQLERAGYRVIEAADGNAALRLCREAAPDVILSDWLLGGCSGIDLCREHRDMPRTGYGFFIDRLDIWATVIAALLVTALVLFAQYTKQGRAMRAVADDHQAAMSVGISLRFIWVMVWSIAGFVALVAGIMWGTKSGVQFSLSLIALKALPVLMLGGFTSIPGAIVGGLIIGVGEKLSEVYLGLQQNTIDAQENPLTNTVTYGVHKFHRFHTISNHFYISRPIFLHRPTFDAWPDDLKAAMQKAVNESVAFQRGLHVKEELDAENAIKAEGCEIVELDGAQHDAFAKAVQPIYAEARKELGNELFDLAGMK